MPSIIKIAKRLLRHNTKSQPKLYANISYLTPNQKLYGKTILITGGGKGIGEAFAKKFASEGGNVLIVGRDEKSLKKVSTEIGCKYLVFDLKNTASIKSLFETACKILGGRIDVLVNNAGVSLHEGDITRVTEHDFDAQIDINLKAAYFLSQEYIKTHGKKNASSGSILFVSSERGQYVDDIPYGLTKAAINSLVGGLSKFLIKSNIRVNAIAPGVTASAMTGREAGGDMYAPQYATGRTYQPEEVAEIACFLISDAAACLSGQIIYCNNGDSVNSYRK